MKKKKKTELTISKIMDAAMKEFGENGYAGGTINTICKTGINKGLIYHNFSGKDELYLSCVNRSCQKFMEYIKEQGRTDNPDRYMTARMDFFNQHPCESHIFFEALLNPPSHLAGKILQILSEFNELNEKMYTQTLDALHLREGVSRTDAVEYFHLMQLMLNGYFSSPAFQNMELQKKVEIHEMILPKLLDYMLYGIAKGEE